MSHNAQLAITRVPVLRNAFLVHQSAQIVLMETAVLTVLMPSIALQNAQILITNVPPASTWTQVLNAKLAIRAALLASVLASMIV